MLSSLCGGCKEGIREVEEITEARGGKVSSLKCGVIPETFSKKLAMTASQHPLYRACGTGTHKGNAAIIKVISLTCAFPAVRIKAM